MVDPFSRTCCLAGYGSMVTTDFDLDQIATQVTESLRKKLPNVDGEQNHTEVRATVDDLRDKPIQDYVAVLAERTVKQHLKQK